LTATGVIRFYVSLIKNLFSKPVVAIELTNRCNAHCTMCWRDEVKRKHTDISFANFKTIVDKSIAQGVTKFQLSFFGESTLYHELAEAIAYIKSHPNTWVTINTNAAYLTPEMTHDVLDAGIDLVKVSVDGNNAEEYEQIRIGLKYDKVRDHVKYLHSAIESGGHDCRIQIQGLHLEKFRIDEDVYTASWQPYAHDVIVREEHDLIAKRKEPLLHKLLPCPKITSQLIAMVDGNTSVCAYDWHGSTVTGNILTDSFNKIHYGRKRLWFIALHLMGLKRSIDLCSTCSYQIYRY